MKKNKSRINLKRFRKLCEKFGVDYQTIDINAIWDNQQSAEYNWEVIEKHIKQLANHIDIDKDRLRAEQQEAIQIEEKHFLKEQNRALKTITDFSNPQLDRFFSMPIHLVKMLCKGYGYAIMFKGKGGIGKTFTILKTLRKRGLKFGDNFAFMRGYSTPLALYKFLYQNKDKEMIVLDDVEGIFCDDKGKAILKGALDNTLGKRFVGYQTTSEKAENLPSLFEITAKIITCANDYPSDADFKALMDRCIFYEFDFDYKDLIKILSEIIKLPYKKLEIEQRAEIFKFILNNSSEATQELSIRTLYKLYDCYLYDVNNGNTGFWKQMGIEILKPNPEVSLVRELINNGTTIKQQIEEFVAETGKSRRTFFRIKKLLTKSAKVPLI